MDEEAQHKEFLLAALRAASARARAIPLDIDTIGVALKGGLIGVTRLSPGYARPICCGWSVRSPRKSAGWL